MRQQILDYINGLALGDFQVSNDRPYTESGSALYLVNKKRIYVDNEQVSTEPLVNALDGPVKENEVT